MTTAQSESCRRPSLRERRDQAISSKEVLAREDLPTVAVRARRAVHSYQLMVERMACSKSSNDIEVFAPGIRFASAPTTLRNGASGSVAANAMAVATAWGSEGSPESRLVSASRSDTAEEIQRVVARLRSGLAAFLADAYPGRSRAASVRRAEWAEVLELSPKGFKFDAPTVADYRRRLTTLARGVAADIDG